MNDTTWDPSEHACVLCGALIADQLVHNEWHDEIDRLIRHSHPPQPVVTQSAFNWLSRRVDNLEAIRILW